PHRIEKRWRRAGAAGVSAAALGRVPRRPGGEARRVVAGRGARRRGAVVRFTKRKVDREAETTGQSRRPPARRLAPPFGPRGTRARAELSGPGDCLCVARNRGRGAPSPREVKRTNGSAVSGAQSSPLVQEPMKKVAPEPLAWNRGMIGEPT